MPPTLDMQLLVDIVLQSCVVGEAGPDRTHRLGPVRRRKSSVNGGRWGADRPERGRRRRVAAQLPEGKSLLIGKRGAATTALSTADADRIEIRGRDLAADLMGSASFTAFFFFLTTGRMPSEAQRFFLDVALVAIAEHGLTPTVQAARMTYAADPEALQGAVAAGILGCGTVVLGTARLCGALLADALSRIDHGVAPDAVAEEVAAAYRKDRRPIPGYGHPVHKPVDPRAERIIGLAVERGIAGRHIDFARRLTGAVARAWGKPLPMNVSMAIAASMRDLDVPDAVISGIPILARTAGLIAHLAEEARTPIGFLMASEGEAAICYVGAGDEGEASAAGKTP
jgi:citrate synthase